jgi:hypothetical protein
MVTVSKNMITVSKNKKWFKNKLYRRFGDMFCRLALKRKYNRITQLVHKKNKMELMRILRKQPKNLKWGRSKINHPTYILRNWEFFSLKNKKQLKHKVIVGFLRSFYFNFIELIACKTNELSINQIKYSFIRSMSLGNFSTAMKYLLILIYFVLTFFKRSYSVAYGYFRQHNYQKFSPKEKEGAKSAAEHDVCVDIKNKFEIICRGNLTTTHSKPVENAEQKDSQSYPINHNNKEKGYVPWVNQKTCSNRFFTFKGELTKEFQQQEKEIHIQHNAKINNKNTETNNKNPEINNKNPETNNKNPEINNNDQ